MRLFKYDEYLEVDESTYIFNMLKQEARQALVKIHSSTSFYVRLFFHILPLTNLLRGA